MPTKTPLFAPRRAAAPSPLVVTIDQLTAEHRVDRRTVQRRLRRLELAGLITAAEGGGRGNEKKYVAAEVRRHFPRATGSTPSGIARKSAVSTVATFAPAEGLTAGANAPTPPQAPPSRPPPIAEGELPAAPPSYSEWCRLRAEHQRLLADRAKAAASRKEGLQDGQQ